MKVVVIDSARYSGLVFTGPGLTIPFYPQGYIDDPPDNLIMPEDVIDKTPVKGIIVEEVKEEMETRDGALESMWSEFVAARVLQDEDGVVCCRTMLEA